MPYPCDTTGLEPTNTTGPPLPGSHTGLSMPLPVTISAATSAGALSTVAAVYTDVLPRPPCHMNEATCPAAS